MYSNSKDKTLIRQRVDARVCFISVRSVFLKERDAPEVFQHIGHIIYLLTISSRIMPAAANSDFCLAFGIQHRV